MIRSTRDFWVFHAVFCLLAAVALFLSGLTYGHAQVALVRNIYNPIVGLACSFDRERSWRPRWSRWGRGLI